MHFENLNEWQHDHSFGQERKRTGETRTLIVTIITALMMVVEIASGVMFGSMALLADGLHMGSHAAALSISLFAYIYSRRHAKNRKFTFGTGKVNALGGFTGAVLLVIFAAIMVIESVGRFITPIPIAFDQAIFVAVIGLIVNGACALLLNHDEHHHHGAESEVHSHHQHDHNLRAAYLHVLADALTSVLAIFALLTGKYFGLTWMDPAMGIVGAILVTRWSLGLLKNTSGVLLDREAPDHIVRTVRQSIEAQDDNRLTDLHIWSIGPGIHAAELGVVTHNPRAPSFYKQLLPKKLGLAHVTVEIYRCEEPKASCFVGAPH